MESPTTESRLTDARLTASERTASLTESRLVESRLTESRSAGAPRAAPVFRVRESSAAESPGTGMESRS